MKQWIINLVLASLALLAPAKSMLLTCLVLILADLVTGLLAAWKTKEPITSAGIRRTVVKLFVYELAIILAYITQKYLLLDSIPASNIVAGAIGLAEMVSCMENLNRISGTDLLKSLISKLGSENRPKP